MDDDTQQKTCTGCGESKPLTEFGIDRQKKDGRAVRCKPCKGAQNAAWARTESGKKSTAASRHKWVAQNPDRRVEIVRSWREAHPGYAAASNAAWREANPEAAAEYYLANRQRILDQQKANREANPEKEQQRHRAWRLANPEKATASVRRWQKAHPEKAREISHRRRARLLAATVGRIDLQALWTGACGICSQPIDKELRYPDPMSRSIDHIVPLAVGGTHEQSNLQWAHLVCNNRKGANSPTS